MAIVVYRCDVCKRTAQLQQNIEGLERIQRCTITHGCRGKLYQTEVLPDYIRGELPSDVPGLDNWIQRNVLFNYTQAIERDEWVINHKMGTYPIVSVFVDRPLEGNLKNREEITPTDIIINDKNTITLKFDRPWSGIAQLVGRQSDPNLLQPYQRTTEQTVSPVRLSLNGAITIATRIATVGENPLVSLDLQYTTSTGTLDVTYNADDQPSINSAWINYNKVIIKGKIYTVRSFNGLVSEMSAGSINSGSAFNFVGVDETGGEAFRAIEKNEILILLASDPYQVVDKQRDRFIDVTSVTSATNPFSFYYDTGEFFAEPNVVQTTYPLIRSV